MTKNPANKATEDVILLDMSEAKKFLRWLDFE